MTDSLNCVWTMEMKNLRQVLLEVVLFLCTLNIWNYWICWYIIYTKFRKLLVIIIQIIFSVSPLCLLWDLLLHITEKTMAPHSSTLSWKIPWTEESGRLQTRQSRRVRHDWATSLSLFTFMPWRMKWQPSPVFLPGETQGWGSLVGCHQWGCTELDTTEAT